MRLPCFPYAPASQTVDDVLDRFMADVVPPLRRPERVPSMSQVVRLERTGHVSVLTIDRPDVLNALNRATWRALRDALASTTTEAPRAKVLVIRGAGERVFLAGADLSELDAVRHDPAACRDYVELVESVMSAIEQLPMPVITMVNGSAVGAGVEIMAASDIRMARAGAHIRIPAAKLGLAITALDINRLERVIGLGRTQWLLLSGETITAEDAQSWGLVHTVHPAGRTRGRRHGARRANRPQLAAEHDTHEGDHAPCDAETRRRWPRERADFMGRGRSRRGASGACRAPRTRF